MLSLRDLEHKMAEAQLWLHITKIQYELEVNLRDAMLGIQQARQEAAQTVKDAEIALREAQRDLAGYQAALRGPRGWIGWEQGCRRRRGLEV